MGADKAAEARLVEVDSTIVDLKEGLALLYLLQDLAAGRLIHNGVALGIYGTQVDVARRVVLAPHIEQHVGVAGMRVPVQEPCPSTTPFFDCKSLLMSL